MASFRLMTCLCMLLVLLPNAAMAGDALSPKHAPFADHGLPPNQAPFLDNLCDEVECGKGTCKSSLDYKFNFICECDSGWKRISLADEEGLQYLPCIIPNCTLNDSCMPAAPPAPSFPYNASVFDRTHRNSCYWTYCGQGTCNHNNSSVYRYSCECETGYSNLLNITTFPCYSDCAIGSDCERLGIKSANSTSTGSTDGSSGSLYLPGKLQWITVLAMILALALLK